MRWLLLCSRRLNLRDAPSLIASSCSPLQLTRGMNGALLLTGGEACPAVVPAPFELGPDLTTNAVVAAGFRLPPHQLHAPRSAQTMPWLM